jgi:hypothetical protein
MRLFVKRWPPNYENGTKHAILLVKLPDDARSPIPKWRRRLCHEVEKMSAGEHYARESDFISDVGRRRAANRFMKGQQT